MLKSVLVKLNKRSYKVVIKNNLLGIFGNWLKESTGSKKVVILTIKSIFKKHGVEIKKELNRVGVSFFPIFIPDGEEHKNPEILMFILRKMAEFKLQRDSCLIAFGGGVVGDLGGFAASVYMRGIDFVQIPTTLLAQVDASIGGKNGVDYKGVKNLFGTFYQPKAVLIDPNVLSTLSRRQYITGLAEVIKYATIADEKMFNGIENNLPLILARDTRMLEFLIFRSCEIKAKIVAADERETGIRAWLNYGHTLGHALESYFDYKILTHGEAIGYGMLFAAMLSQRLGLCHPEVVNRQHGLLQRVGLLGKLPSINCKKVYEKMFMDKKVRDNRIQFILTRKIGLVTIQKNIPKNTVLSTLDNLQREVNKQQ